MNKKTKLSIIGITGFGLLAFVLIGAANGSKQNIIANATSSYTLTFNPFEDNASSGIVRTMSGYDITIHCSYYSTSENNWGVLSSGASVFNETKISGIQTMTITYFDNTSSGTMKWRWDPNNFYDPTLEYAMVPLDSSENLTQVIDFDNARPSYFWMQCGEDQHCSIKSIVLTYSCVETSKPEKYKYYAVSYYNSNFSYETYKEEVTGLIGTNYFPYGSLLTTPSDYGTSWYYGDELIDLATFRVTCDMTLIRHRTYTLKFVEYTLNDDGETYTATLTTTYNDNNYQAWNLVPKGDDVDKELVSKVIVSTGIKRIAFLTSFSNMKEIVFSSEVTKLNDRCIYTGNAIESVTFEGDLPELTENSIYCNYKTKIYVNEDVYDSLESKFLYGYRVYTIGDNIPAPVTMTLAEYKAKTNQQAVAIANHLLSSCKTDLDRQLLKAPLTISSFNAASVPNWHEIKDFALNLTSGCLTDTEKAHEIYSWIQNNVEYNASSGYLTPYEALIQKKGVCNQFASLMIEMLSAVGVQSFYMHGYKSMPSIDVVSAVNEVGCGDSHGWVIAYIDGGWYFYDPTTASLGYNPYYEKMSIETISSMGYCSASINHSISCIPEEIDLEVLEHDLVFYREGKVRKLNPVCDGGSMDNFNGMLIRNDASTYSYVWLYREVNQYNPSNIEFECGEVMSGCVESWPVYGPNPENEYQSIIVDYDVPRYLIGGVSVQLNGYCLAYLIEELGRPSIESMLSYFDMHVDENLNCYKGIDNDYHFIGSGSALSTVTVPSQINSRDVVDVGEGAFDHSNSFDTVIVSEGVSKISADAFKSSLISEIYLPSTITKICCYSFSSLNADIYLKRSLSDITLENNWNYMTNHCTFHENYPW